MQVEHSVRCRHAPTCDFHPTQTRVLGSPLRRNQVVQRRQAREKRRLPPARVMASLPREELAVHGLVGLVSNRAHRRHLGVFEHRIPPHLLLPEPVANARALLSPHRGRDVIGNTVAALAQCHQPQAWALATAG